MINRLLIQALVHESGKRATDERSKNEHPYARKSLTADQNGRTKRAGRVY